MDTKMVDDAVADPPSLSAVDHVESLIQYIATSGDKISEGQQFSQAMEMMRSCDPEAREEFADRVVDIDLRLLQFLKRSVQFTQRLGDDIKDGSARSEDVFIKDVKAASSAGSKKMTEIGLWSDLVRANAGIIARASEIIDDDEASIAAKLKQEESSAYLHAQLSSKTHESANNVNEASSRSRLDREEFNATYMDHVVSGFTDELDLLRQEPGFGEESVSLLIDCLNSGTDIWDSSERALWVAEAEDGPIHRKCQY